MKTPFEKYLINQKQYEALSIVLEKIEEAGDIINPLYGSEIMIETGINRPEDEDEKLTVSEVIEQIKDALYDKLGKLIQDNKNIAKKVKL